jgi:hypothetical protein
MQVQALVYIHPDDFKKLLISNISPIDIIMHSNLPDRLEVCEVAGVVYRLSTNVEPALEFDDEWAIVLGGLSFEERMANVSKLSCFKSASLEEGV